LVAAVLFAAVALATGLARPWFHAVYERVAGVEVLGPYAVRVPPKDSPYQRWLEDSRGEVPEFDGLAVDDVRAMELRPWPQLGDGVRGRYLRLARYQTIDARLIELPAGGRTAWARHMYETGVYFLGGPGHTELEQEGRRGARIDWFAGGLLSVPLNVRYRHVNDSASPLRLLAFTGFPFVLNSFADTNFIRGDNWNFDTRYDSGPAWIERHTPTAEDWLATNFVEDVRRSTTAEMELRGAGNTVMHWAMAGNSMLSLHASEITPGTRKKAHRHSNEVIFLVVSGSGATLAWPGNRYEQAVRIDWREGTVFGVPAYWYHQHMNTGDEPARYLSINTPDLLLNLGLRFTDQLETEPPDVTEAWERLLRDNDRAAR